MPPEINKFSVEFEKKPRILGMTLLAMSAKYGSYIFIRDDLKVKSISAIAVNNVEIITAELPDVVTHATQRAVCTPSIGTQKPTPDWNRRFQQPQHHMGLRRYRYQWCSSCTMGRFEHPNTHPRCETDKIFQRCKMEERLQPKSYLCIFQHW